MRRLVLNAALAMAGLGGLFLALSCGSEIGVNKSASAPGVTPTATASSNACDVPDIANRRSAVANVIALAIDGDAGMKNSTRHDVQVQDAYLQMRMEGLVEGKEELLHLSQILSPFMKEKCLMKVTFVPMGSIGGPASAREEFEWTSCEPPKYPCPNGECGDCRTGTPGNGNVNSNANTNSNTNANGNANAHR